MTYHDVTIPEDRLREFCRRHRIRRLSLFGSILRDDFRPDSDVDVLVEFEPDARVGYIRFAAMELELGELLGRTVDLRTVDELNLDFAKLVLREAKELYVAA